MFVQLALQAYDKTFDDDISRGVFELELRRLLMQSTNAKTRTYSTSNFVTTKQLLNG